MEKGKYISEKITEAMKPENLAKRESELKKKILNEGLAAFSFENVCRLCYGNEAVDLWQHKEKTN